jgi:serine/threonine-protein kinase
MNEKVPSLRQLQPDLPPELDAFMQKAMAKLPTDRYSTPQEFITALEQVQQLVPGIERQKTMERVAIGARVAQKPDENELAEAPGGKQARAPQPPQQPAPPPQEQRAGRERVAAGNGPTPQKQARLLVLSSNQAIPLTGELMVVGRHDPVLGIFPEINLADKTVGRRHAYLRRHQGQYSVEDLNALNKTRLNGVVLTPHEERPLKDGDILRFGSVEVRFELR